MTWLDELDAAAQAAHERQMREHGVSGCVTCAEPMHDLASPERIRALIACVRAADAAMAQFANDYQYCEYTGDEAYDAARAALETTP